MPYAPRKHIPAGQPTREQKRQEHDRERGSAASRGYGKRWQKYRLWFLARNPLCDECLAEGKVVPATVVDHTIPHKGDYELFWRESNHKPKCKMHHDRKTGSGL